MRRHVSELARLVVPALRWDAAHGFGYLDGLVDDALELGAGGFVVEGGPRDEVASLVAKLHRETRHPLLIAARAERGAGETIAGLTPLPPLGAVGTVAVVRQHGSDAPGLDVEVVRRAARITVRELRGVGVNWALAPACGAATHVRAASDDPAVVAAIVAEWVDACQAEAVLACALDTPGIGAAAAIHARSARGPALRAHGGAGQGPMAAAVDAGVASAMLGSAPDDAALPAAVEALRGALEFDGLVVSPAFDRAPGLDAAGEPAVAVRAVASGCDVVLAPIGFAGVVEALEKAASGGTLGAARLRASLARLDRWSGWARPSTAREPTMDDVLWTRQLADRATYYARGGKPRVGATMEVIVSGPAVASAPRPAGGLIAPVAPSAVADVRAFTEVLRAVHVTVVESNEPVHDERGPLAIVFVPAAGATGEVHPDEAARVQAIARRGVAAGRDVVVVACCHPRGAATVAGRLAAEAAVLCAWDASRPMLEAAARAIVTVR
jgi:beta-glucosidase-like glycosyl hydrolase